MDANADRTWRFVDATTGELVLSYNILHATRSWFRLSESGYPFTFKGYCEPKSSPATVETFAEYGITYIEPPKKIEWNNEMTTINDAYINALLADELLM
ncbi:hypothetical protein EJG51_009135 [Undibacterium piscinae]|uniref:Uncharacterized protein n=1 Tax=Undibacterium piscinae TaxID=2495591 RepID=A0A6M4A4W7_9BURK|nr:hypothetical protein EJG51_009135 [Undibacterium piscinae]